MSFSDLSSTIISQAISLSPPAEKAEIRQRASNPSYVRTPDHRALIGKAILSFHIVGSMTLPEGWTETRQRTNAAGQRIFVEYGSSLNTDLSLSFTMADRCLDAQSRLLLLQILQLSAPVDIWIKQLAQTQYFGGIARPNEFLLLSAHSGQINSRRALIMEGLQTTTNRNLYAAVFDTDGGRMPFTICYYAPKEDYSDWLRDVLASLTTIVWK
ncbi:MAG TPA: hypothetical protein V6C81_24840 [Planktothrix sp.]|jgi:hypothetical protein